MRNVPFLPVAALLLLAQTATNAAPPLLDERFELPPGFHIYRAAGPDLCGGSYALTFDGEGRLLVGDGNAVRRLADGNGDGVFDSFEVIANGLGGRGPQGLLVWGDRLYAVGGDGVQLFSGYQSSGPLKHERRLGQPFRTGGDHDAHTIFRGHDGFLYLMAGNGAGLRERTHINSSNSPVLFEHEASVFRVSPDGAQWECFAAGGRNPPSLGMNYLGELFSFDSDMEWHVGLPWYRPVRLNHWVAGGDQGWQDVGAYPPYFLDCLPGVLNVGRGSPTWGTFYEHFQFPEKYRDAFLVCDYRWKRESNDKYSTTGRLVAFLLERNGAGWNATMETLARPRPGARDDNGKPLSFALVDAQVAPDGSLFVSDHNQGVWRIFFAATERAAQVVPPPITFTAPATGDALHRLLNLPQPGAEWSRVREEQILTDGGAALREQLDQLALDSAKPLRERLRALRLLTPGFAQWPDRFVATLAGDKQPELRGQAAWLLGLRGNSGELKTLLTLLDDRDPFVRRRAAEAFTRLNATEATPALLARMNDPVRLVRYVAMTALAHRPTAEWLEAALARPEPQIRMRALVAAVIRREPPADETVRQTVTSLLREVAAGNNVSTTQRENQLDLLRVLGLFEKTLRTEGTVRELLAEPTFRTLPEGDTDLRREQVRILGTYRIVPAFGTLLGALETERDDVARFHIAQALAHFETGWRFAEEEGLLRWFVSVQRGWFTEFSGKGVEFPEFWGTVLDEFGRHHRPALLLSRPASINFAGQLGGVFIDLLADEPNSGPRLFELYRNDSRPEARLKIVRAFQKVSTAEAAAFLRQEYAGTTDSTLRNAILRSLAAQRLDPDPTYLRLLLDSLRSEDVTVVRAGAETLARFKPALDEPLARLLITRMTEKRELLAPLQSLLANLSQTQPPGRAGAANIGRRPDEAERAAASAFWQKWYEERFGKKFETLTVAVPEKSDEEVHRFILSGTATGGNGTRGGAVFESLQCHTCHGGVAPGREGRIFGPDLAGVTRRLSRVELADALVYPSKQVADRFKAVEIELNDATPLAGFITEQSAQEVTLVARDQVYRIARKQVRAITPQSMSLMPEHLLNRLSSAELSDLLAFLEER